MYRRRALRLCAGVAGAALAGCAALGGDSPVHAEAYETDGDVDGGLRAADLHGTDATRLLLLATPESNDGSTFTFRDRAASFVSETRFGDEALLVCQFALPGGSHLDVASAGRVAGRHLRVRIDSDRGDGPDGTVHTLLVRLGLDDGRMANVRRVDVAGAGRDLEVYNVYADPLPDE